MFASFARRFGVFAGVLPLALALAAPAASRADNGPAPAPAETVDLRVDVTGDTFVEGQTVPVTLEVRNRTRGPIALLEAQSSGVGLGTQIRFALPLAAYGMRGGGETLELQENLPEGQMGAAVGTREIPRHLRLWKVLGPGETMSGVYPRKVWVTPESTLTYEVSYVTAEAAVGAGALYVRAGELDRATGYMNYRKPADAGLAVADLFKAVLASERVATPARCKGALALPKVAPRAFSLEAALAKVVVSQPVCTWLGAAQAWVIEKGQETHFVTEKEDVVVPGRYAGLVDRVEVEGARTLSFANWDYTAEDVGSAFVRDVRPLGVKANRGKALMLEVPAVSLLPFLRKAAESGVTIEGTTWRGRR